MGPAYHWTITDPEPFPVTDADRNHTLELPDGRTLGYALWGPPAGTPVVHCHGSASSRLERPPDLTTLDRVGVRLITIDRPGHGLSTFLPGRRLVDWAGDVAALADHLGIDRFSVTGYSMGGPHALACAVSLPDRVEGVALVCGIAPFQRPGAMRGMTAGTRLAAVLARRVPCMLGPAMAGEALMLRAAPHLFLRGLATQMTRPDRRAMSGPSGDVLAEAMPEAFRAGLRGPVREASIVVRDWGLRLDQIGSPVDVWQGDDDGNVPLQAAEFIASAMPSATLHRVAGAGHLLLYTHWEQVLATLHVHHA